LFNIVIESKRLLIMEPLFETMTGAARRR